MTLARAAFVGGLAWCAGCAGPAAPAGDGPGVSPPRNEVVVPPAPQATQPRDGAFAQFAVGAPPRREADFLEDIERRFDRLDEAVGPPTQLHDN